MRFFSNDAKENTDGEPVAENDQDRTETDGATVPQQRTGSPWSAAPGSETSDAPDTEIGDRESAENTDDSVREDAVHDSLGDDTLRRDDSEVRHDGDDLVRDGDASPSDDLDLPLDDRSASTTEEAPADEFHPGSHRADGDSADASDSVVEDRADGDSVDASDSVVGDRVDGESADSVIDEPGADQRDGTTTTYGPDGSVTTVDESADTAVAEPVAADTTDTEDRTDDERDLDEASPVLATAPVETTTPVDSTADDTVTDTDTDAATDTDTAPVVAAVPVGTADAATTTEAAKPDPSAAPVGDRLFTDGDSFNDRLRDVSLNFVDNPKEATEQAGALVDEAIDKVTSALKSQKDALAGEGDDTEKLRVQLRGYRDILKRLTAL